MPSSQAKPAHVRVESSAFEALVSETAAALIETPSEELNRGLRTALSAMAEALGMDRATLIELDPRAESEPAPASVICSWARPPLEPMPPGPTPIDIDWGLEEIAAGRPVSFDSLDDLPVAAASLREWFRAAGVRSHLTIPMVVAGQTIGTLSFARATGGSAWPTHLFDRLLLLARIFGAVIERRAREDDLRRALDEVSRLRDRLEAERNYLREEIDTTHGLDDIVHASEAFARVLANAERVARTDTTVLLLGETGTGKEMVARHVHRHSPRQDKPLITVNCAAMPSELIESELFGHEKGAFTGAGQRRRGRFKLADGGTIFLDEVGELDAASQAKLLRVLEEGELQPLGSDRTESVDVRVIAATNRDLTERIEEGRFRDDLYYRLSVFPLRLPPLRERLEDVEPLVRHFIDKKASGLGSGVATVSRSVLEDMLRYDWPGNVRELENVVERSLILSDGAELQLSEILGGSSGPRSVGDSLSEVERSHILDLLETCHWKINGKGNAAERLGLHPNTLRNRMKKLGIQRPA